MTIGYVTRNYPPNIEGGAEISLFYLANALAKKGNRIIIFVPEDKIDKDQTEGKNPKIYRFHWRKKTPFSLENPFDAKKFARKVLKTGEKPDLIDGWNYITPLPILSKKWSIPYIVSLRDATSLCDLRFDENPRSLNFIEYFNYLFKNKGFSPQNFANGIFGFYLTQKRQEIIKKAVFVTFASQALKKVYGKINNKCDVIYSIAKNQKNENPNQKIFFYAGRMSIGKGGILLSEIAKEIEKKRRDIKFIFANKIAHEKTIDLMKKSYAVVVPSLVFEAFPRAAIEAVAAGIPVIGTNVGGVPEAIGKAGIITAPKKEPLKEAIINLANNKKLYESLKRETKNQAEKFEENVITEKVIKIYEKVLR